MYPIKKIVVCLDLSEIDETLIEYASLMCASTDAESLLFMHISKALEIPKEIRDEFPDLLPADNETVLKRINTSIEAGFDTSLNVTTEIILEEGSATQKISKYVKENDIDLVIIGRKINLTGTGIIPQKLIRLLNCNVLLIPEKNPMKIERILVPIDFSKQSGETVDMAIKLSRLLNLALIFQNVYILPSGYLSTGKTEAEFSEIMKSHAQKDCEKFMKAFDLEGVKHEYIFTQDDNKRPAMEIYQTALKHKASIIMVGSKGTTGAANILLGSVAEQLANYDSEIPLLITKNKEDSMSFFKALMKL